MADDDTTIKRDRPVNDDTRPHSFFDALGLIRHISTCEINIPDGAYPETSQIHFFNVAVRHSAQTTITTFLLAPITMLAIEKYINVFGSQTPNFLDKLFTVLLSSSPSIGFALFFAFIINKIYIKARITKSLLSQYVVPYILTKLIITFFMFLIFYIVISKMTDSNIEAMTKDAFTLASYILKKDMVLSFSLKFYHFLFELRATLMDAAIYSAIVHLICMCVFAGGYLLAYKKSLLIDIFREDFE